MGQDYFQFKQFRINQHQSAMKVTTDACLFGSWIAIPPGIHLKLLDIGTGTGLLALLVAQNHPDVIVDAVEIDEAAFQQARENFKQSPWADRLHAKLGDVKTIPIDWKYDIIISNPPFYEKELQGGNKEKNMAHHDGGLLLTELFEFISSHLSPGGLFFLLLPFKRNEEIKTLLIEHFLHVDELVFVRPSVNHSYSRIMAKGRLKTEEGVETRISELAIKDNEGNYSADFVKLLNNFYLNL